MNTKYICFFIFLLYDVSGGVNGYGKNYVNKQLINDYCDSYLFCVLKAFNNMKRHQL